jgi:hypothetical protein
MPWRQSSTSRARWSTPALAAIVALVAWVAVGCGAAGPEVGARSAPRQADTNVDVDAGATQVVRFRDVEFTVPADWPVYDLEADPTTCVRFDVHAVYLGHPGSDMQCPATVNGHAASVLVEPLDGAVALPTGTVSASAVNGLAVEADPTAAVEGQLRASLPTVGIAVTLTVDDSDVAAQGILQSFHQVTP